jgi:peptidyl-prolyl cis-trans isomerase-like 4
VLPIGQAEEAYLKMDNTLIDDRRIHVDFSQSVSKTSYNVPKRYAPNRLRGKGDFNKKSKLLNVRQRKNLRSVHSAWEPNRFDNSCLSPCHTKAYSSLPKAVRKAAAIETAQKSDSWVHSESISTAI